MLKLRKHYILLRIQASLRSSNSQYELKTMAKKNIIIAGYPKSGTTWISRLVAELATCPLQGDWGFGHIKALYEEGVNRDSPYDCYKTHFTYDEISSKDEKEVFKIIHVLRDPRDVVISGSHYFNFTNTPQKVLKKIGLNTSLFSISSTEKKKRMIKAIIEGDKKVNQWVSLSWKNHLETFIDKDVLSIRYEDMLINPQEQCSKIVQFLGIDIDVKHIDNCIKKQSFDKKKEETSHSEDIHFKKLLRKGEQGYWKNEFTEQEKDTFKTYLATNTFYN